MAQIKAKPNKFRSQILDYSQKYEKMDLLKYTTKKIEKLEEIFEIYFICVQFYSLRVKFSMVDYERRAIQWNWKHFKRYIQILIRSCFIVIYLWIMILFDDGPFLVLRYLPSKITVDRSDLVFGFYSTMIILLEILSFNLIRSLSCYDYRLCDALHNLIESDHHQGRILGPKILNNLIQKYRKLINCFNNLFCATYFFLNSIHFYIISFLIGKFLAKQINIIELCFSILVNYNLIEQMIFYAGQFCFELFSFAFTCHFLTVRFQTFVESFRKLTFKRKFFRKKQLIQQYSNEYLQQSFEIARMNHSKRETFLIVELISKCLIAYCVLFFHGQTRMNIYSNFLLIMASLFYLVNGTLLASVSSFKTFNDLFFHSIFSLQCRNCFRRFRNNIIVENRSRLRREVKRIFFIENIASNPIGFTWGAIFRITKFKYIDMQLIDVVLILLFYKRFLL